MKIIAIDKFAETNGQIRRLRKANECIIRSKKFVPPTLLFDEFWREGELALFFGETGTGKSVLAVQIADALGRGRSIDGFRMPKGRRRVLYVDLVLADKQFQTRYSIFPEGDGRPKSYKFAENLYRDFPPAGEDLIEWVREKVTAGGIQAVVIDDLSAIKRTHDGTLDTLRTMRRLRTLRDELKISILVLTDAANPGRREDISEADLGRSRILCSPADSVFGIGRFRHSKGEQEYYLVQTRSCSGTIFWKYDNSPSCTISRRETGMLAMNFDEWYAPDMDAADRRLICRVREMREAGATYRVIASDLGISKSWAAKLYKKWIPALDEVEDDETDDQDEGIDSDDGGRYDFLNGLDDEPDEPVETAPAEVAATPAPPPYGPDRVSIYDFDVGWDGNGREIYIQSADPNGTPMVWYRIDEKKDLYRFERGLYLVRRKNLGKGVYL